MTRIFLLTVSNQYNGYNLILRRMALKFHVCQAQRRQRKIKNILFHTATATQTSNQTNATRTTKTATSTWVLRQPKFWSIHIQISTNFKKFVLNQFCKFHPSPICTFRRCRKTCTWLDEQFRTFHPSLHESVTNVLQFYNIPNRKW